MSNLTPSPISEYQDMISYPSGVFETFTEGVDLDENQEETTMTMLIYSSQIHLRVILNRAHNTIYGQWSQSPYADSN